MQSNALFIIMQVEVIIMIRTRSKAKHEPLSARKTLSLLC